MHFFSSVCISVHLFSVTYFTKSLPTDFIQFLLSDCNSTSLNLPSITFLSSPLLESQQRFKLQETVHIHNSAYTHHSLINIHSTSFKLTLTKSPSPLQRAPAHFFQPSSHIILKPPTNKPQLHFHLLLHYSHIINISQILHALVAHLYSATNYCQGFNLLPHNTSRPSQFINHFINT